MNRGTHRTPLLPEEPFLFFQEPPDWRWVSFAEAGRRIADWRSFFAEVAPRSRIGIPSSPSVEALLVDLAVRSQGLVAVPLMPSSEGGPADESVALDLVVDFGALDSPDSSPRQHELVETRRSERLNGTGPECGPVALGDCALTMIGEATSLPVRMTNADLESAVEGLGSLLRDSGGFSRERSIVVHGHSLADRDERVIIEWAVRTAAAIVVASGPEALAATSFWVRPTVLHGTADELRTWRSLFAAGEDRERGIKARFRRLRQVVVCGGEALDQDTDAFWRSLGARIVRLPAA